MKHTPGPWMVKTTDGRKNIGIESAEVVRMDDGATVASVHITAWKQDGRDARPNARLIAAAPDLLEALQNALASCYESADDCDPGSWQDLAKKAIAKAEGA